MDKSIKIGWIGTGVMGAHMCRHLLNKGYNLSVFNRTQSKAQPLLDLGAKWSEPKELAK
jgi:3-hydroxyisobutyrate dehydrogenase